MTLMTLVTLITSPTVYVSLVVKGAGSLQTLSDYVIKIVVNLTDPKGVSGNMWYCMVINGFNLKLLI